MAVAAISTELGFELEEHHTLKLIYPEGGTCFLTASQRGEILDLNGVIHLSVVVTKDPRAF